MTDYKLERFIVRTDKDYDIETALEKCGKIQDDGYIIQETIWITPNQIWVYAIKRPPNKKS